jgi:hypothetical protein
MKDFIKQKRKGWSSGLTLTAVIIVATIFIKSCASLENIQLPPLPGGTSAPLTEAEIIRGLKEALRVGAEQAVAQTNKTDGFFKNDLIRIPWPQDAIGAYNYINNNVPGMRPVLDEVVLKMNRGAEQASEKAKPIFLDVIMNMSIQDARNILMGEKNAATQFLRERTYQSLHTAFKPDIHKALESVGAATAWSSVTTYYNPVARVMPSLQPINTDLSDHTTTQALNGLFLIIEQEELKIRTDPVARVNDILRRVFGSVKN